MEVILFEKIDRLGGIGDLVNVKAGFARNYLLPQGKAKVATEANKAEIESRRAEFEKMAAEALAAAEKRRDQIEALSISITAKSGTEGKLFGSVGNIDIAAAITEGGVEVEKREVRLPEGPIRQAGEYEITLHLHTDVDAIAKITIIGQEEA
ncbi:MAG: 50S ribosomal protein L9 [Gammaproteobacteria bacterium]|nr:50S ribosomal protein L9 [Gammaproteobacteria bacterium]MBT8133300.1 50S ribosomal protein L9 [Gammaproteobacteria bacterium]NNJ49675.1 50S ribosomal protein L9 [Gammaproteobacteria bacterium]